MPSQKQLPFNKTSQGECGGEAFPIWCSSSLSAAFVAVNQFFLAKAAAAGAAGLLA